MFTHRKGMKRADPKEPTKAHRPKREVLDAGRWFPIAKTLTLRCCRCSLTHTHQYRVRANGSLELKVT